MDDRWTLRARRGDARRLPVGAPVIVPLALVARMRDALIARGDVGRVARPRRTIRPRSRTTPRACRSSPSISRSSPTAAATRRAAAARALWLSRRTARVRRRPARPALLPGPVRIRRVHAAAPAAIPRCAGRLRRLQRRLPGARVRAPAVVPAPRAAERARRRLAACA